jgi:hypothetical protein
VSLPFYNNFGAKGLIFIELGMSTMTNENKQYKGRVALNGMMSAENVKYSKFIRTDRHMDMGQKIQHTYIHFNTILEPQVLV